MSYSTEVRILKNPQSLRNIEGLSLSYGLSLNEMVMLLQGKKVLDLGSGFNGLAIDANLR